MESCRVPTGHIHPQNQRPIHAMVEGLRYVVRNKMVLGAITLDLFAVFRVTTQEEVEIGAGKILGVGSKFLSGKSVFRGCASGE